MEWGNLFAAGAQTSIISDLFRNISFLLDSFIYGLVPLFFNVIYKMYDLSTLINTSDVLSTAKKSIYSLLAIFMFFKVAFSLLGMLVDPNMIENKEKGAGKLVSGVMVTIALIALMPSFFDYAMMAQSKIMEGQLIEKAILGNDFSNDGNDNLTTIGSVGNYTLGNRITLSTWGLFLQPTTDTGIAVKSYNEIFNQSSHKASFWYKLGLGAFLNETTGIPIVSGFLAKIFPGGNALLNVFDSGVRYQLSYIVIVSTVMGCFLLWSMIQLCIDVAYRSLKMFALEMLSPIAVLTYIDPKSSKDGVFAKWLKEVVKTYTSLFVRIFVFAFASLLLSEINIASFSTDIVVRFMYILAVIAFIKAAPKFIDGILGTELSKEQDTKFAGDLLKAGGAAVAGGISGAVVANKKGYNPIRGGFEGLKSGATSGYKAAKGKDMLGVIKAGMGGDAMRKYYGLPTAGEARKKVTEVSAADRVFGAFKGRKTAVSQGNFDKIDDNADFVREMNKVAPGDVAAFNAAAGTFEDKKKNYIKDRFYSKIGNTQATKIQGRGFDGMSEGSQRQYRASYGNTMAIQSDSVLGGHDIGKKMLVEEQMKQELIMAQDEERQATEYIEQAQYASRNPGTAPPKYTLAESQAMRTKASDSVKNYTTKLDDAKKATAKVVEDPDNAREAKYYNDWSRGKERDG